MNPLFRKYQKVAQEAEIGKGTKKARLAYARMVQNEPDIHNLGKVTRGLETVQRLKPGMLIAYEYRAKYEDTLPFYDRFPLVFVLEITKDGWTGVNMHYLHPRMRAEVFYQMDRKKVHFGNNVITRSATKKYLADHVVRKPKVFPSSMWEVAVQMPFENFTKSNKYNVWTHTNRKK